MSEIIEVKPDGSRCLKYLSHITQIQFYGNSSDVEARGPKVETRNQLSETRYRMPAALAFWIRDFKMQAQEAFWVGKSRIDGKCIIRLRGQLYKIRIHRTGRPELECLPGLEESVGHGTPDAIDAISAVMVDYKTVTVPEKKMKTIYNAPENVLLLL